MDYTNMGIMTAVVIGVSEVIKKMGFNAKYIPIVNIIIGVAGGIMYVSPVDIRAGVLQGVIVGLSASGLYSGVKNVSQEVRK